MLKGIYYGKYKKLSQSTGQKITVFKYALTGTEQELAKYKNALEAQGQPCHTEEFDETHKGKMIYFTTVHNGDIVDILISKNNCIYTENKKALELESLLKKIKDPTLKITMAQKIADVILDDCPQDKVAEVESYFSIISEFEDKLELVNSPKLKADLTNKINRQILGLPVSFNVEETPNKPTPLIKEEQKMTIETPTLEPINKEKNKRKELIWSAIGVFVVGSIIMFYVIPQLKLFIYANATVIALVAIVWLYLESKK